MILEVVLGLAGGRGGGKKGGGMVGEVATGQGRWRGWGKKGRVERGGCLVLALLSWEREATRDLSLRDASSAVVRVNRSLKVGELGSEEGDEREKLRKRERIKE